jgi:hypothetical protein
MNTAATTKLFASGAIRTPTSLVALATPFEVVPVPVLWASSQPFGRPAFSPSGKARVLLIVSSKNDEEDGDRSHPLTSHCKRLATAIGVPVS